MSKIIIIDESELMRNFLKEKFESYKFQVIEAKNGFEGITRTKNELPDLIIMDYNLSRLSCEEYLSEKKNYKAIADIPIILIASKVDMQVVLNVSKFRNKYPEIKKFLTKPFKIDILIEIVSQVMGISLPIDTTPCNLDVHLNDNIIFIELAQGFNRDKIDLLKFKLLEILSIYGIRIPKILIIISDMKLTDEDAYKLDLFLNRIMSFIIKNFPGLSSPGKFVKILTVSDYVKKFISIYNKFKEIEIVDNINQAMDSLMNIDVEKLINVGYENIKIDLLSKAQDAENLESMIELKFESDKLEEYIRTLNVAIIEEDEKAATLYKTSFKDHNYNLSFYTASQEFNKAIEDKMPDLIILNIDLKKSSGFDVLKILEKYKLLKKIPVLITSEGFTGKTTETIKQYGIKNYFTVTANNYDPVIQKANEFLLKIKSGESITEEDEKDLKKHNIAIVDDDELIREFLKVIFDPDKYNVSLYENGGNFTKAIENNPADLIFLDLLMPVMSGFDVLKWLKEKNITTPVVVFSAMSQKETVQKALSFGIRHYLIKPPQNPDIILCKTREILHAEF